MHVALVTCSAMPGLAPDDRPLLDGLRRRGIVADPIVWEDPVADWAMPSLCVIRSCWDYAWRLPAFQQWLDRAGSRTRIENSPAVVRWNAHKQYLVDLAQRDVPSVPTVLLRAGARADLRRVLAERGWTQAVVKAAVGNSGRYARPVAPDNLASAERYVGQILEREDVLVQPLIRSVAVNGELSLVFIDGRFTHAVRKRAAAGDFRVHDDYGGSVELEDPGPAALDLAERAMAAAGAPTLYGRVDLVEGPDGEPLVMELELVEPELFLRYSAQAVERLVEGVIGRLEARGSGEAEEAEEAGDL
jgi:glutathione synthase/RimK-type ligase-like ATP-grasp enzyme